MDCFPRWMAGLIAAAALTGCTGARSVSSSDSTAAQRLREGQSALKEGRTDQAIAALRLSLAADPSSKPAMRSLVEAHFRSGRIEDILRELGEAVALRPGDALAHYGLGLAYYARSAGSEALAVKHLSRAAELEPQSAEYHFRLGVIHLEAERFGEAVVSLSRARELDPAAARHHISLAQALSRTGDRKGALTSIRAILELTPAPHDLLVARQVMSRLNDPFHEFPKVIESPFQQGLDYMERSDSPQQAIVVFQEILERFPDLAVVHAALGLSHQRLGDDGRAMDELRRALDLAPNDPRNHLYIADLYFGRERFEQAAESYRAAIERDPLAEQAYERLGQIALQRNDAEEAARWLRPLSLLRPGDAATKQSYGLALLTKGDLDGAEREFTGVLALDARNVDALLRLGQVHLERQKRADNPASARELGERAARCFEQVLDLQPQNAFAARMLKSLKAAP